jgi:hypothetical protein
MKNTTATPVFVKTSSNPGKQQVKTKRIVITDIDLYEEEEMIKVKNSKRILNKAGALIIKKNIK